MSSMFGPNRYARGAQDDTGWVDLTLSDVTNFEFFTAGYPPQVRRVGSAVYLRGTLKLLTATYVDSTTMRYFLSLSEEFWPSVRTNVFVCQGSLNNRWSLAVEPDGQVAAQRYGPDPSTVGTWLPFDVNWLVD